MEEEPTKTISLKLINICFLQFIRIILRTATFENVK